MKRILVIALLLIGFTAVAQNYDPSKVNAKAKKLHEEGLSSYRDGDLKKAVSLFKQAISIDGNFVDAILDLATLYNELKDYNNAIAQFESGLAKDTSVFKTSYLPYSTSL